VNTLTISPGQQYIIPYGKTLINNGHIQNFGTIVNSGTIENNSGGIWTDNRIVTLSGTITN
jgi:hypothetical protein